MIHIAIVEDEIKFASLLREYIIRYEQEQGQEIKISSFTNGEDLLEEYQCQYDIILMDIQLTFMNGMTAAENIRKFDKDVIIMFITNMTQYAVKGYEVDALDYILKPVEYFAFSQKLEKAIARCKKEKEEYFMISTEDGVQKKRVTDILYIESQGHNVVYYMKKSHLSSRNSLKVLEMELKPYGFYRCSKGFLVNLRKVDGVKNNDCIIGEHRIPVSRIKRKEFMEQLMRYINEE